MSEPLIFNIQRFSVHDGAGIRTTVFFAGCPLRCRWCHNPEGQDFSGAGDGTVRFWPLPELVQELERDRVFYDQTRGGVTLSGGEPMVQDMDYVAALTAALGTRGIHVAVDTCGQAPFENFARVLPFSPLFLYDLKALDDNLHLALTGAPNTLILSNLAALGRAGADICLRLPLLAGLNDAIPDMERIAGWLDGEGVGIVSLHLLPVHAYARGKYEGLGRAYTEYAAPGSAQLEALRTFWQGRGYQAVIGGALPEMT